ncbi:Endonuclease/exonuclease/phosphatase, partial [Lactarius quietus]
MRNGKIAILAVQETHLDEQTTQAVHKALGKRILILNSQMENNPRSSAGVAFVLNKDLVETKELEKYELIKGRAIAIKIKWKNGEDTLLINVYALNKRNDHKGFWEEVEKERINRCIRKPDFVLGDFNVTEEPIDRAPAKMDSQGAVRALREFRLSSGVQDQWRHAFPKGREYTYRALVDGQPIKSRLDRIYVSHSKVRHTFDWQIAPSSIPTDHWLVTVKYAPKCAPHIGDGRWTWPLNTLHDNKMMSWVVERGMELQNNIDSLRVTTNERTNTNNPQTLWKAFK